MIKATEKSPNHTGKLEPRGASGLQSEAWGQKNHSATVLQLQSLETRTDDVSVQVGRQERTMFQLGDR